MASVPDSPPHVTLEEWRRLLAEWSAAYCADPDARLLRACGVSVAQRVIAQLERDAQPHDPAGKAGGGAGAA